MDFSKVKDMTIPEGKVLYIVSFPKNEVTSFQNGYRFSSSGALKEQVGSVLVDNFIPCKTGSKFYMAGGKWGISGDVGTYTYVFFYDDNKELVTYINGDMESQGTLPSGITITEDKGFTTFDLSGFSKEYSYIRLSVAGKGEDLVVSVGQPPVKLFERFKYINQVPISIDTDGSIYNNGLGFKDGYRVRSGGAEAESAGCTCSGFIPFKLGDTLRIYPPFSGLNSDNAINFCDASFNTLGQMTDKPASYGICVSDTGGANPSYLTTKVDGVSTLTYTDSLDSRIAYVRVTHSSSNNTSIGTNHGERFIVTINDEIPL